VKLPFLTAGSRGATPVVGMLHLMPLAGAHRFDGDVDAIRERVLQDAEALAGAGVQALLMENFGDAPFFPGRVPASVVAHMTALAVAVRERFDVPLGINCLRNDPLAALAVAHASGGTFVRANVLCGARVTDQGIIQGVAHELLRERQSLRAQDIAILADVDVKHSAPLGAPRPAADEVKELAGRGGADGVIASGSRTGQVTQLSVLREVKEAAGATPVLVGSGVTVDNVAHYAPVADAMIVGSALKHDGVTTNPVDPARVRELMAAVTG